MDPVTYRNAAGEERIVSSVDGKVAAEFAGFYHPDSPSGRALRAEKAAETRKANAAKKAPAKTATKRASAKKTPAPSADTPGEGGPTSEQMDTGSAAAQAARAAAGTADIPTT